VICSAFSPFTLCVPASSIATVTLIRCSSPSRFLQAVGVTDYPRSARCFIGGELGREAGQSLLLMSSLAAPDVLLRSPTSPLSFQFRAAGGRNFLPHVHKRDAVALAACRNNKITFSFHRRAVSYPAIAEPAHAHSSVSLRKTAFAWCVCPCVRIAF